MSAHSDYRHAAFTRAFGTAGQGWTWDAQSAIASIVPGQEWSFGEDGRDRPDPREIADYAALARIGGREYTRYYVSVKDTQPGILEDPLRMAGIDGGVKATTESLHEGRSYRRGQYSHWVPTPESPARMWGSDHVMSPPSFAVSLPEAAFDWPIYKAARRAAILVVRDPDSANDYTVDGDVVVIDIDLGSSWDGTPRTTDEKEIATEAAASWREQALKLPVGSKVREQTLSLADEYTYPVEDEDDSIDFGPMPEQTFEGINS